MSDVMEISNDAVTEMTDSIERSKTLKHFRRAAMPAIAERYCPTAMVESVTAELERRWDRYADRKLSDENQWAPTHTYLGVRCRVLNRSIAVRNIVNGEAVVTFESKDGRACTAPAFVFDAGANPILPLARR
jgi:hypothetical protein